MSIDLRGVRNFGIMAHIDAGKTTFTERILFYTGKLHNTGEVHEGTATMDWMPQEQERGITITSAATSTKWISLYGEKINFNIIDTPGHIDFTAEVERSLRVLDGMVLLLDASAGVESQTKIIWNQANFYRLPRLIFCNKMDKPGSNYWDCSKSLITQLNIKPLLIQIPIGHEEKFIGIIDLINMKANYWSVNEKGNKWLTTNIPHQYKQMAKDYLDRLIIDVIELDRKMFNCYINGSIVIATKLISLIRLATISGNAYPLMCGSAFKNKAIQPILDAIVNYLPSPDDVKPVANIIGVNQPYRFSNCREPITLLVFKIVSDIYVGSLSYVRIYSGSISLGSVVYNARTKQKERIIKILKMHANSRTELDIAYFGDIIAIAGLRTVITGDTLCCVTTPIILNTINFPSPVIHIALEPKTKADQDKIIIVLNKFCLEDPTLNYKLNINTGQIILAGMGELHLDIIIERINREHNLSVNAGKPQVSYKETIANNCLEEYTHKKQTGGAGQYAKVKILFELNTKDEFEFCSKITGGSIPKEYIPAIKKGLEEAILCGPVYGYPIIRLKAILLDGDYHSVDSSSLAFEIAAKQCLKQAMHNTGICILEPTMKVEVCTPDQFIGSVISDLSARHGQIISQISSDKITTIIANVPLANMFKFIDILRSLTKGQGNYFMKFNNYEQLAIKTI